MSFKKRQIAWNKGAAKFQKEYDEALLNPPFCTCNCGGRIILKPHHKYQGIPKYITGHHVRVSYPSKGKSKLRANYEAALLNPPLCACGCGHTLKIKLYMRYTKIPKYLFGHQRRNKKHNGSRSGENNSFYGKRHTKETKEVMSSRRKGKTYEELYGTEGAVEIKLKRNEKLKKPHSDEWNKKIAESHLGLKHTEESKQKMREAAYRRLPRSYVDTEPELILQEALINEIIIFETQKHIYGIPDIFIEPNICIFVDGIYWHANPDIYKDGDVLYRNKTAQQIWDKDKRVTDYLINSGYTVLRFWEHDIHNNLEEIVNKIKEVIRRSSQNVYTF
jgi:DNA mismatch endonuclease (patch repair protein)